MEVIDEINIDKVCRSCLREEKGMYSLFAIYNGATHQPTAYNTMFMANSSVSVQEGDGLPDLICERCRGLLVQAYSFRLMSEDADVRLRTRLGLTSSRRETFTQTELGECLHFYNCGHCQKKFKAISSLERHCRRHARGSAVACTICGHFFSNPEALSKHQEKVHNKTSLYEDTKVEIWDEGGIIEEKSVAISCELKKESPGARVRIKEEPQDNFYQEDDHDNDDISHEFLEDSTVKQEYQSDQSNTPIEFERKKTSRRKNKKNNLVQKGEDIPESHPCSICTRVFSSVGHLRNHVAKHAASKDQKYPCGVCHKTFSRSSHLRRHQLSHSAEGDKLQCGYCNKVCGDQAQLDTHLEEEHPQSEAIRNPKVAFCSVCDRGFTTQRYLEIHAKSHTGGVQGARGFPCKACAHVSQSKVEARTHMQGHRRAERPFLCSECGQGFTRDAYLTVHMRRHRGEKPFSCGYCGKGFPRRSDLDIHERYHTEDKRHTCAICGKAFHRQYNLKVHLRVHTGERPYACTYCTKAFTQPNDLKAHVRRHTGERFTCELCSAQFLHGYHLTQHRRAVHAVDKPSHIRRLSKFPSAAPLSPTAPPPVPPTRGRARQAHLQLAAHMASILASQQPATHPLPPPTS